MDETKDPVDQQTTVTRLLPSPNLVMFPRVLQLLHVHEPRYCCLIHDALHDNARIATAWLPPGWESQYEQMPPIAATVCVSRIVTHASLPAGQYNLVLVGERRARVCRELESSQPYRLAEIELLQDVLPEQNAPRRAQLRRALVDSLRKYLPPDEQLPYQVEQLLSNQVPLGVLTDIIAFSLQLDVALKQQLLEQLNVDDRAHLLREQLERLYRQDRLAFPPSFSTN